MKRMSLNDSHQQLSYEASINAFYVMPRDKKELIACLQQSKRTQ